MKKLVVCVKNEGYAASLEKHKIYIVFPDPDATIHGQIRVIDESGDDYLYPQKSSAPVKLIQSASQAILIAANGGHRE